MRQKTSFEYFIHQNVFRFKFQRRMGARQLGTKMKKMHIPDVDPVGVLEVTKTGSCSCSRVTLIWLITILSA